MTASLWIEDLLVPAGGIIEANTPDFIVAAIYGFLVPMTIGFVGFTLLYRYLPATRVRIGSAMLGGLVAAMLWQGAKQAFYFYVLRSSHVYSLYGSLAIVPLFLIWIYLNWLIILWGCETSYCHQNLALLTEFMEKSTRTRRLPLRFVGLYLLERLARSFRTGDDLPSAAAVGDELAIRTEKVEAAGQLLVDAGLLAEDSHRDGSYSLLKDPAMISLSEVVSLLPSEEVPPELLDVQDPDPLGGGPWVTRATGTANLFRRARDVYLGAFRDKTLADLIDQPSVLRHNSS
jgi:membrane protein